MRAIVCRKIGSIDDLVLEERPAPVPGERVEDALADLEGRPARGKLIISPTPRRA